MPRTYIAGETACVYVRASKCKWNLLIEFSDTAPRHPPVARSTPVGEEGWFTDVEWREGRSRRRKRAGFGARFDVSTAFRSACYSRIIVTGGTKRMRGSSVHFHPLRARTLCASRVSSQMETNLYAGGTPDRKKRKKNTRYF